MSSLLHIFPIRIQQVHAAFLQIVDISARRSPHALDCETSACRTDTLNQTCITLACGCWGRRVEQMWSCGATDADRTWPDGEIFSFENAHPAKLHYIEHIRLLDTPEEGESIPKY